MDRRCTNSTSCSDNLYIVSTSSPPADASYPAGAGLTISAVAARTGVSVPVLRAWERRFGFPRPHRLASGHRRYPEREVDRIMRVVAERAAGRSVEAAIAAVEDPPPATLAGAGSLFAGLRAARPDLTVHVLSRRAMLALSHAIEDEAFAQAGRPHLVAAFQHEAVYRRAAGRWDALAASAASTIVFADFPSSRQSLSGVAEVALPERDPLRREWGVVCDGDSTGAVVTGWERPDGDFEAVWTAEPGAVRLATTIARALATGLAPDLSLPAPGPVGTRGDNGVAVLRHATALTNRAVAYLDRRR
jgi:DICT domain-containing protein/predicted DNA-binding transcriptional regulator AlpA